MKFELLSLDVWGNAKDGFTVNAAYNTGYVFEFDPLDDKAITRIVNGFFGSHWQVRHLVIDGDPDFMITVDRAKDGYMICQFMPTDKE